MPAAQGHITSYTFVPKGARQTVEDRSEKCSDHYPYGKVLGQWVNSNGTERYLTTQHERDQETGLDYRGARYYDSDVARFLSLDPKSANFAGVSPYNYVLGNPVTLIDPDGKFPYTFNIRAFAPPNSFKGTGFHDDGRGFSTRTDVTSRIKQNFTIDPTARTSSGGQPTSDPTHWNGRNVGTATNRGGISQPEFGTNGIGSATASVTSSFEGSNPAFKGAAPDIEVSSAISITENLKMGQVFVSFDLSSKQFPATEAFVQDNAGNAIFLAGAAAYGTANNLVNADGTNVATMDLMIGINDKGVFQNVSMGGKTYTLDDFNKLGTSKPAGPFPRSDAPGN